MGLRAALIGCACAALIAGCDTRAAGARNAPPGVDRALADTAFAQLVERLSESGGYFDTDNLISNEDSYLHVLGALRREGVEGGAFVGVGPDQSFSYIAQVRPEIAFMVDVRRDNLLQHLWFRALFTLADTRAEYLALMFGVEAPSALSEQASITELVAAIAAAPATARGADEAVDRVLETVPGFSVPLSAEDLGMIEFIHRSFIDGGIDLKFTSHGRRPNPRYPTYRELLLATDLTGREGNYLAREEDFAFLRDLERAGHVVPVVGNLAGDHALAAIGEEVARRGLVVSAFYTSNVEFYLFENGSFGRFAQTAAALPRNESSVIIRSFFRRRHPLSQPGFYTTQLLQKVDRFAQAWSGGEIRSYQDLVTVGALDPN